MDNFEYVRLSLRLCGASCASGWAECIWDARRLNLGLNGVIYVCHRITAESDRFGIAEVGGIGGVREQDEGVGLGGRDRVGVVEGDKVQIYTKRRKGVRD